MGGGGMFVKGGYLGVDFFFIVSGFFLMLHYQKRRTIVFEESKKEKIAIVKETMNYMSDRIKRLYEPYIISILMFVALLFYENSFSFSWLVKHIWSTKWQYLLVHYLGADVPFEFRSIWFISSLILISYFIYFLLCYNETLFIGLAPVSCLLLYIWIFVTYKTLSMQMYWTGLFHGSVLRGFADMTVGVLAAWIACVYKTKSLDKTKIYIIKFCCMAMIAYIMVGVQPWSEEDFFIIPLMFLVIVLSYLRPFNFPESIKRLLIYSGSLSYWIFLQHLLVSRCFVLWRPHLKAYIALPLFLSITYLLAILSDKLYKSRKLRQEVA